MRRTYTLFQEYIFYALLISWLLQSCGGLNNSIIPSQEKQVGHPQTDSQLIVSISNIEFLVDQQLIAAGGYLVTPYQDKGELQASIQVIDEPNKVYNGLGLRIEKGTDLKSFSQLPKTIQARRIRLQFDKNHNPIGATLYQAQLMGGGESEGENEGEQEALDGNVISAYINRLTNSGADLHVTDEKGNTALHLAIKHHRILDELIASQGFAISNLQAIDRTSLEHLSITAIKQLYMESIIDLLINQGADIEARNKDGDTPLHIAANEGHTKLVQYLIEKGADTQAKDKHGRTPLHLAARNGHIEVIKYLLNQGADMQTKGCNGNTPFHLAALEGHTEVVQYFIEQGADKEAKDNEGHTPLHLAAYDGHAEVIQYLIEQGADREAKDNEGWTSLHISVGNGHTEVVQCLIEQGADIEAKDNEGWTPLHIAVGNGHTEVVQYLIEQGADKEARDNSVRKAIDIARKKGHQAIVNILSRS